MTKSNLKQYFEMPKGIYALSHSVGPLTLAAKEALHHEYLTPWSNLGGDAWPHWLMKINDFCDNTAKLINAVSDEICPQTNLAIGFYSFLTAICKLPQHKHQDTIIMHKDAFASMGFVVSNLASTFKLKLVLLESDPNNIDAWYDAFEQHQVLACLITHVHSNTSVKSNVVDICTIAKQFESFACVDIAQSAGIVPIDVNKWRADAVFGSCVKWLCGGPGAGFMFIKHSLVEKLVPDPVGWFSHENPFEFDIRQYKAANNAKRFWGGTPSVAPFVMASASIAQLLDIGIDKLATHNLVLKQDLVCDLPSSIKENIPDINMLGGTICIPLGIRIPSNKTLLALKNEGVKFDQRNGSVRISMHANNNFDDVSTIANCF